MMPLLKSKKQAEKQGKWSGYQKKSLFLQSQQLNVELSRQRHLNRALGALNL
jgi:hypothetical protein